MDNCRQKEEKKETWITVEEGRKERNMDNCRYKGEKKETWITVDRRKKRKKHG